MAWFLSGSIGVTTSRGFRQAHAPGPGFGFAAALYGAAPGQDNRLRVKSSALRDDRARLEVRTRILADPDRMPKPGGAAKASMHEARPAQQCGADLREASATRRLEDDAGTSRATADYAADAERSPPGGAA
jgi:hypothetical protein